MSAGLHLYRRLFRRTRELPRSSWPYYRRLLRENIVSHKEENDPERLKLMFDRATRDAEWVVTKAGKLVRQLHRREHTVDQDQGEPAIGGMATGKNDHSGLLHATAKKCWPVVALLLWTMSSSGLIVLNRRLMVNDGFVFPMALTAAGQTASFLGGCLLAKANFMKCQPVPSMSFYIKGLMPLALLTACSLVFGNLAYFTLSLAFIQILKTMIPAVVLLMGASVGLEKLTVPLAFAVSLITAGTGAVAMLERQNGQFNLVGFAYFALSAVFESLRVLYVQLLLGKLRFNAVEVLVYLSPATAICLAIGAYFWEFEGLTTHHGGFYKVGQSPLQYLMASCAGFAVNVTTYWAIEATSSLTFKVFGCVKNALVVWAGVLMGDAVSQRQLVGYAVSIIGFGMYTRIKAHQKVA